MEEVYILNDQQIEWFNERQRTNLNQIFLLNMDTFKCVEKKFLGNEGLEDVVQYIADQGLEISLVQTEPDLNVQLLKE